MKIKIIIIALLFCSNLIAQDIYKKGYFIEQNGKKTNCFILDQDLLSSAKNIYFKLTKDGKSLKINTENLSELKIGNYKKYERHTVSIDKNSRKTVDLDNERALNFKEDSVFLETLLEGEKSLYSYNVNGNDIFFYKNNNKLTQLQYKKFLTQSNKVGTNKNYIKQLRDDINCYSLKQNNIKYTRKDFVTYFINYHKCINSTDYNKYIDTKKSRGKIYIKAKFSIGKAKIEGSNNYMQYKIGSELEYVFSSDNNKWSIFIEPQYQSSFKSQKSKIIIDYKMHVKEWYNGPEITYTPIYTEDLLNYSSLEFPFGFRRYFFLNKKNAIFLNTGAILDFEINFGKKFSKMNSPSFNAFIGLGYKLSDKYSLEIRYLTPRDIVSKQYYNTKFNYNSFNLKIGYSF